MHRTLLRREEEAKLLTTKSNLLTQEHDTLKRERSKLETEMSSLRNALKSRDATISELQKAKTELQRTIDAFRSRTTHPLSKTTPIGDPTFSSTPHTTHSGVSDARTSVPTPHHSSFSSATLAPLRSSEPPSGNAHHPQGPQKTSTPGHGKMHYSDTFSADEGSSSDLHLPLYSTDNGEIFKLTDGDVAGLSSPPPESTDPSFTARASLKPGELQRRIEQENPPLQSHHSSADLEHPPGSLGRLPKEAAPISDKTKRGSLSQIFAPFLPKSLTGNSSSSTSGKSGQATKNESSSTPSPVLVAPPTGSKTSTYGPNQPQSANNTSATSSVTYGTGSLFSYTRTTPGPPSSYSTQEVAAMNQSHMRAIDSGLVGAGHNHSDTSLPLRYSSQSSPPAHSSQQHSNQHPSGGIVRSPSAGLQHQTSGTVPGGGHSPDYSPNQGSHLTSQLSHSSSSHSGQPQLTSFGSSENIFSSSFSSLPDHDTASTTPPHLPHVHGAPILTSSANGASMSSWTGVGPSPSQSTLSTPGSSASSSMADLMVFDAAAEARLAEIQRRLDDANFSSSSLGSSLGGKSNADLVKLPTKVQTTIQAASKSKTSLLCLAVDPTGARFIAGGETPLTMYDALSGTGQRCFKGTTKTVTSVSWDEKGALILATGTDNTCRVWFPGHSTPCTIHHSAEVQMGCFLSSSRIATIARNRTLSVFDISASSSSSSYKFVRSSSHKSTAYALCANPITSIIYTGHLDKQIRAYDSKRDATISSFDSQHTDAITGLQLSPDGSKLYSTSRDNTIRCFDVDSGNKLVAVFTSPKLSIQSNWTRAALSTTGAHIAVGSSTGHIYIWDTGSTKLVATLKGSNAAIIGVSWNPLHSNHLVSFDETGVISIWS